jgi:uncharacterized membrane protein YqaE (UPF0057 family)
MDNKFVLIIISILLPPLAVFLKQRAGKDFLINILLCFLFYVPAIIHAIWLVTKKKEVGSGLSLFQLEYLLAVGIPVQHMAQI